MASEVFLSLNAMVMSMITSVMSTMMSRTVKSRKYKCSTTAFTCHRADLKTKINWTNTGVSILFTNAQLIKPCFNDEFRAEINVHWTTLVLVVSLLIAHLTAVSEVIGKKIYFGCGRLRLKFSNEAILYTFYFTCDKKCFWLFLISIENWNKNT